MPVSPPGSSSGAVLVAGATASVGGAVVAKLLADGRPVTATWRSEDGRDALAAQHAGDDRVSLVRADLTDADAIAAAVAGTADLAAVVNLSGGYAGGHRLHEADPAELERMWRRNVVPTFMLARAAVPALLARGGGAFIAFSARGAVRPGPNNAAYAASKAAVLSLVQSLDAEHRKEGLRANAILPAMINTEDNRAASPGADTSNWVSPEAIAEVVAFLVSDASAATTGAAVPVYGRS